VAPVVKANVVVAPPIRKMDVGLQTNVHLEVSAGDIITLNFIKRSNEITNVKMSWGKKIQKKR
jgi:hypothetical protein